MADLDARLKEFRLTLTGDWTPTEEAERFVIEMAASHPAELDAWMRAHAVQFCSSALRLMRHQERLASMRKLSSPEGAFADAARLALETGDMSNLSHFDVCYRIDRLNTQRPLGQMTGADHLFVAESYELSGKRALLLGSFHRAIARKVGDKTTAEVLSEDAYGQMLRSLTSATNAPRKVA